MGATPVAGETFTFGVGLYQQANTKLLQAAPTIAAGDFQRSINGGLFANLDNLPTVTPAAGRRVQVVISAAETTAAGAGGEIFVQWVDAAGAQWCDSFAILRVDSVGLGGLVDAICDEPLTAATHNVPTSLGRRIRALGAMSVSDGTAVGGTINSITLNGTASTTDNIYNENLVAIVGGTGVGQSRLIAEYTGSTKVAIVDRPWDTTPNATSEYQIIAFSGILLTHHGLATAGGASTITFAATASAVDDVYIGSMIVITSGTGLGQARLIADYDGTGKVATVTPAWTTAPDNTSVYKVIPVGRSIVASMQTGAVSADALAADAITEIQNGVIVAPTGLDSIVVTAPTTVATTFPGMVVQLWRRFFKKATMTSTALVTYANDGTTAVTTQALTDDGSIQTQGAAT